MSTWVKFLLAWIGMSLIVGPLVGNLKKLAAEDDYAMYGSRR